MQGSQGQIKTVKATHKTVKATYKTVKARQGGSLGDAFIDELRIDDHLVQFVHAPSSLEQTLDKYASQGQILA